MFQRDPFNFRDLLEIRLHRHIGYLIITPGDQQGAGFDSVHLVNSSPVFQVTRLDQL